VRFAVLWGKTKVRYHWRSLAHAPWGSGHVIDGKYRLTSKLGEGGMGAVWCADHLTLNAPVAVKLLDPSIAATEDGAARFIREAQAAAALRSAHVVQTFDYGVSEGVPFIVMELLVGDSLGDRLEKGPLSPPVVASLLKQVSRAIGKAHQQGIVHRDLKPDNIFLVESDGDDFTAKVLDFGIAKATSQLGISTGSKTRTGALLGTPYYMSPEQAQGIKEVDFRTDLWALAVITFECLTGKRPFESEALGDLLLRICASPMPVPSEAGAVPPGFDQWFAKAASREREERFASAPEMAKAFENLVDPNKVSAGDSFISLRPASRGASSLAQTKLAADTLQGTLVGPSTAGTGGRNVVWIAAGTALGGVALIFGLFTLGGRHGDARSSASSASALHPPAPLSISSAAPLAPAQESPPLAPEPTAPALPAASAVRNSAALHRPGASKAVTPKRPTIPTSTPAASQNQEAFDPLMMRR
jgi:serine/threonine protein kinase